MTKQEIIKEIEIDIQKVNELSPIVMINITDASGRFESIFPFLGKEDIIKFLLEKKQEFESNTTIY